MKTLEEAREYEAILKRCKALWDDLPSLDDLEEMNKAAGCLVACLEQAAEAYMSDDLPSEDDLERLAMPAANLVENLREAAELQAG